MKTPARHPTTSLSPIFMSSALHTILPPPPSYPLFIGVVRDIGRIDVVEYARLPVVGPHIPWLPRGRGLVDPDAQPAQPPAVLVAARQCAGDELEKRQRDGCANDEIEMDEVREEQRIVALQDAGDRLRQRLVATVFLLLASPDPRVVLDSDEEGRDRRHVGGEVE